MPYYDYSCKDCKQTSEIFHSMKDDSPKQCSTCGSENTSKKIPSKVSARFVGTGFYETDYKNDD